MWKWITGTVRPIALLAGLPVIIGALLAGTHIGWSIVFAVGAAMLGCGFANAFNAVVDREIDRTNPAKKFLAQTKPVAAWYSVLFLMPPLAICLRENSYNHWLFAVIYFVSFLYSYAFGRVRIVKRVVVAAVIAATVFLYIPAPNLSVWLFAGIAFVIFLQRERNKDEQDKEEDNAVRFAWDASNIETWCILAPMLAIAIYFSSLLLAGSQIDLAEAVIAFGIALSVWSYVQIRYRYKWYRMRLTHQTMAGRLGSIIAVVGLMPSFVTPLFVLIVLWNVTTIVYRSFLGKAFAFQPIACLHDSWLWASLPVLAMTKVGYNPILLASALAIGCAVYFHERIRLRSIQQLA